MKKIFVLLVLVMVSGSASYPVQAGNGSEACVTHCSDAASAAYEYGTSAWSSFFRGCMMACWM